MNEEWFAPYVCKAKAEGVVQGYSDGRYRPGQAVNMVEALKIAFEAFEMPVDEVGNGFWYQPYVDFAHRNDLFSKYSYFPDRAATRAEVAFVVHKLYMIKNKKDVISQTRDSRSEGCGHLQPSVAPTKFNVNGVTRSAITVIPSGYNPNKPVSLIFAFHGRTNSNAMVKSYYGIEKPSKGQAIVVYPAGLKNGSSFTWGKNDYQFFDVMIEQFFSSYCIDTDKVYAIGHSLGGYMTNNLACARGNVLRAVGSLGGGKTDNACSGPVGVMLWHNPDDRLSSFANGEKARNQFLEQNRCTTALEPVSPFWGDCVEYKSCLDDAPLVWCPHNIDYDSRGSYYPHTWPKGTGEEMWKFFQGL